MTEEKMLSVSDVVRNLHRQGIKITKRTIQNYCRDGVIPATKGVLQTSRYYIPESAYLDFERKLLTRSDGAS
jgi:hypothetical protein